MSLDHKYINRAMIRPWPHNYFCNENCKISEGFLCYNKKRLKITVLFDRQMGQKGLDFGAVHSFGMLLVVKEDEAFDPIEVGLFGTDRVVFGPPGVADLIEQFGG
jgi:hypothetical protein